MSEDEEMEACKCGYCGRQVLLPFDSVCSFCHKTFCCEHRLVENHRCLYLPYVMELEQRRKPEIDEIRKHLYRLPTICVILVLLCATLTCISHPFGYEIELRDPTLQEALEFLESDQTDKHHYREEEYTCVNFAKDFRNSALKSGYRCGYVIVYFPATGHLKDMIDRPSTITIWSHALNCFNTTNYGPIYVEPQTDEIVALTRGQPYWDRTKYFQPVYNDTIVDYRIFW